MAMTLADVRAKYPQYKDVDDNTLADAIYNKHYAGKDRREFDARIGLKPYQNFGEAIGTAVGNIPAGVERSKYLLGEMIADTASQAIDPRQQMGFTPPLKVEPGAPVADLLTQPAAMEIPAIGPGNLLPKDMQKALGRKAAEVSLGQQLRRAAPDAALQANALDVAPGSLEEGVAGGVAGAVEMAAPMAASILVRNPAPLVTYFTARTAGDTYGTAKETGAPYNQAMAGAALNAAAEAATEALAGKVFLDGGKTLVGSVLKGVGTEALTEGATEALQALVDSGVLGVDMTLTDALNRVKTAAIAGGIAGGIVSPITHVARGPGEPEVGPAMTAPEPEPDAPIEDRIALPGPQTMLALPSPEQFRAPNLPRRQPAAPVREEPKPPTEDEIDYQARVALQRTRQQETAELLQTARETITPLGTFDLSEVGEDAAGKVRQNRVRTGRPIEAPITIEEMARAKVPQRQIDAVIAARRPMTEGTALTALDIMRTADAKNIIPTDSNFAELALRTTGQRNVQRMTQAQLNALKTTLDAMPTHAAPVTVPLADASPFTESQYGKAVDALRTQGRYTAAAIKDATGLKTAKDINAVRDAMVRRGQLTERGKGDYRLYDTLGVERQTVPDDLPPGAFKEYTARRVPISKVRVTRDGKSVGTFSSAAEARAEVSKIRDKDKAAAVKIEPAEETAWGVMENRYDEQGNLLGSVVVDSHRDEAAARKALEQLNAPPDTGARYTQTAVEPSPSTNPVPPSRPREPMPAPFTGRLPEIVKRLNDQARDRKLPLLGVRVQIKPSIVAPEGEAIEGLYFRKLISLTAQNLTTDMSTDQIVEKLAQVMDHELIHALRGAGVLGPETAAWKNIVRYTRRAKRPNSTETYFDWARRHYTNAPGYNTPDAIEEEAIAEAFRAWAANRRNVVGQPASIFRQLAEWFKRLVNAVPQDAFTAIESGQMVLDALKPPGSDMPRARATQQMEEAAAGVSAAQTAKDENLVRVRSREYLRAREQARDDRFGRSGPKTVLGTTPSKTYATGDVGDVAVARVLVDKYRQQNSVQAGRLETYLPEPVDYMLRVADAQQRGQHSPGDAAVAKAYRALVDETKRMYQALGDLKVSAWSGNGAPYASPAAMLDDIAAGRLTLRLSDEMFGPGADNPGHPLNTASGFKTTDDRVLTNNDLFRIVHDVYGHGQSGFRDDARGAYNAYHEHARLLSPEARRALATETLAQRAWQEFGPHLRRKDGTVPRATDVDYLPPNQKEFAEQKAFLLDEDLIGADPGWALAEKASGVEDRPMFSVFATGPREFRVVTDSVYPRAGRTVDGLEVRGDIPNLSSISATFEDYTVLPGVRAIPFRDFHAFQAPIDAKKTSGRVQDLAGQIRASGEINPLIVVLDQQGPYILEGAHRIDALQLLGKTEFPAVVVVDQSEEGGLDIVADDPIPEPTDPRQIEMRFSKFDDNLPGGRLYGNPNRSPGGALNAPGGALNAPGGALNAPGTPAPAFTNDRPGNRFFGGEMAEHQLQMARTGERGATMIYLNPEDYLALADAPDNPEQTVYDEAVALGYTFSTIPSLVIDGYAGNVRAVASDGAYAGRALAPGGDAIPVILYPKKRESLGLVTALEAPDGSRVPWPRDGRQENFPDERLDGGPKYSLNAPFGDRVPDTPPGPMFNIVQQRVDGWVGKVANDIGRSKRSLPVIGSIFDARVKLQDKMLSIKEMIEQIKEAGGSIDDLNDTYMLEQLYHGKVFDQIQQREQDLQVPLLQALKDAYDGPNKVTPTDFEDYLYARHAPERNAYLRARGATDPNPSGMSDAEASVILDRLAIDGKLPDVEALAAMADAITADTTRTRVEAGLISPEAAASSPYQYYVPLRGFAEEALDPGEPGENQTRARSGKGFSVGGREDRTVTGRGRKAGDLLGHLFLQNTEAVIRAQKNDVALSFMRLLQQNKDLGFGSLLKTAPTRRVVGANGMIHEAGDPNYRQAPDIVTAKWKGNEIVARVTDPRLARAIKSDYVSTSNDLVNALTAIGGRLNRYLATINTSLNPEFLISNLARDMQTAGVLSQQYDIKGLGTKIVGNAPKAMAGIREVLRTGEANSEWAQTFREMQKAGGTTEFLGIHDLETQVARIRRSITQTGLNATPRKAAEYLGKVGKFIDDYNKVAENAFRLSAYKAAREAGVSVPQAAYLAKNLTVNFNKGGELKAFMNAYYLFYNASTQGSAVLMNGLKNKRVQKLVAGITVAGFLQDMLNRALSGDDDENGVTDYDDIPAYVLETNFVLMDPLGLLEAFGIKSGYFAIPMPYGFNAFYNLGRNTSAAFSGSPVHSVGKSVTDSLLGFVDAFNPLGGVQSIWNFIAPTFADPAVDLITNKDYAGNNIVPDRPSFGLPIPESQKYWNNTGDVPVWVAEHLNRLTGGNEVRKGAADISPETLQYGFDYVFGATGKFVQRLGALATDTGPKALQGDFEDIEIGDIPFARRVVGSIGKRGNTERYYEVAQEVATVAAELELFTKSGRIDEAQRVMEQNPVEVSLIKMFEQAQKTLQDLRKQLKDVRANEQMPAAQKREIERQIKEQQDQIMARVNTIYFEQKKGAQ
jgi:Large polyvalent protein associated domain 38/ParB-like nuclease domain